MKETITSSNRASFRGHIVENGLSNFLEGITFACSIFVFIVWHVFHGIGPELFISAIMQNMALVSAAQLVNRDI